LLHRRNGDALEIESAPLIRSACPLLAASAASIGDVQIRNSGTIGGSVAHADPAADYPAALLALEARVCIAGPAGSREVPFEDFLVDTFTTLLEPGELVTSVLVPVEEAGTGTHYQKQTQPASGFAIVGVAARIRRQDGVIQFVRVGVTGLSGRPADARRKNNCWGKRAETEVAEAAAMVDHGVTASADLHASAAYRSHLARVAAKRAILAALRKAH
jgi:carbon-monoxide dehydrogenase medium subunit